MPLASGARLGPYEVLGLIGAGGMGEVYKARDTRLDRTVAIKVLPAHVSADPERRARFEGETTDMTCTFRAAGRVQNWMASSALATLICLIATTAWGQVVGPEGNIPLPSEELAQRLSHGDFEIVSVKGAGGGLMGAKKLRLRFDDGVEIDVKWKRAPEGADGWNNSPRREIAAYEVQTLFLEPDDYVVPVSAPRCIPLDAYAAVEKHTQGNVLGADCVLGLLSVWLQNVTRPEKLFDPGRFQRDGTYARSLGHLNILTYLINHQDARANNFLISTVDQRPQVKASENWNRQTGTRLAPGRVQFGLTVSEIEAIEARLAKLLRDVDEGRVAVLQQ